MKILVLGGNRFMGYFLVRELIKGHNKVTILNRGSKKHLFQNVEEIYCDRNDPQFSHFLKGREFDVVFDNSAYNASQVLSAVESIDKIGHYVFMSSVAVYDKSGSLPFTEHSKRGGNNVFGSYAHEKSLAEDKLTSIKGLSYTILRPTYVYGELDYSGRIQRIFDAVSGGKQVHIPLDNPKVQFVYVKDVVNAQLGCINNSHAVGKAYNICDPKVVSYGEFVELAAEVVGKQAKISPQISPDFPYEDWEMHCDVSRSIADLKVHYTPLRQGLLRTWDWHANT